ncbi:hypothetical protein BBP40_012302 [Aspergillus hancockii]|nr:hypothetical protein BBP40_012302 [Aspergillus hancockii]
MLTAVQDLESRRARSLHQHQWSYLGSFDIQRGVGLLDPLPANRLRMALANDIQEEDDGCISSVMRLVISIPNSRTTDNTYAWFGEFLWTAAEITSGIIASCLPALPTFCRHFFQKTRHLFSEPSTTGSGITTTKKIAETKRFSARPEQNISLTDLLPGSNLEMLSHAGRTRQTFEGTCYTTVKAKVESPVEKDRENHPKTGDSPGRGILKTVEVDVESDPEQISQK